MIITIEFTIPDQIVADGKADDTFDATNADVWADLAGFGFALGGEHDIQARVVDNT